MPGMIRRARAPGSEAAAGLFTPGTACRHRKSARSEGIQRLPLALVDAGAQAVRHHEAGGTGRPIAAMRERFALLPAMPSSSASFRSRPADQIERLHDPPSIREIADDVGAQHDRHGRTGRSPARPYARIRAGRARQPALHRSGLRRWSRAHAIRPHAQVDQPGRCFRASSASQWPPGTTPRHRQRGPPPRRRPRPVSRARRAAPAPDDRDRGSNERRKAASSRSSTGPPSVSISRRACGCRCEALGGRAAPRRAVAFSRCAFYAFRAIAVASQGRPAIRSSAKPRGRWRSRAVQTGGRCPATARSPIARSGGRGPHRWRRLGIARSARSAPAAPPPRSAAREIFENRRSVAATHRGARRSADPRRRRPAHRAVEQIDAAELQEGAMARPYRAPPI